MNDKPTYNPKIHHRRSIRLKGYDYSQAGLYFITICCQDRACRFGKIENDEMILNEYGNIANNEWQKLQERFTNFEMDVFQIMPNHMHGIIALNAVGAGFTPAPNNNMGLKNNIDLKNDNNTHLENNTDSENKKDQPPVLPIPTVGDIVGAYKSLVAKSCLKIFQSKWAGVNPAPNMGKLWQRNYYEHIIRNEQSYQTISEYIIKNPAKWKGDKFYK